MKALNAMPELLLGLNFYYNGFIEVSYDRPIGLAAGPIPYSSIIKWCEQNGIRDINEKATVMRYFRAMEAAELKYEEGRKSK